MMDSQHAVKALGYLYRIVEVGERGYAVAATNINNRALKILFRLNAYRRARIKDEIFAEIQRLGGQIRAGSDFLGIVHRGRIDIFAALTIGAKNVERVVLKEVLIGERVAIKTFEKTLKKDLPPDTREMVMRQFEEVRKVVDQVRLLNGQKGKRLLVHLYDSKADTMHAVELLETASSQPVIKMNEFDHGNGLELYKGRGTTILETIISGSVGGAVWGVAAGGLAAVGNLQIATINPEKAASVALPLLLLLTVLGLIAGGVFIGSMIGLFIGWGITTDDTYVSNDSVKHGQVLMRAIVDEARASRVWDILNQVDLEAKAKRIGLANV